MMTQELEISILAAPLAAIDRRMLSQAWYSALRCAHDGRASAAGFGSARVVAPSRPDARRCGALRPLAKRADGVTQVRGAAAHLRSRAGDVEHDPKAVSRSSREWLARRIAAALAYARPGRGRATFSIGPGGARVHVIFQMQGDRVTLLAICRPEIRPFVARSLAHVRIALRARGVNVEVEAKGAPRCS